MASDAHTPSKGSDHPHFRIALAGNPNCGKTTIFNALTGLRHKVANYPGVTVEKKEGRALLDTIGEVTFVDLPGTYSLSSHSLDESIATRVLTGEFPSEPLPDLIISVIDASNLERNLYLTSQLLELGIPLIGALNMSDIAEKRGISIKRELLARALDIPLVTLAASKKSGIDELRALLVSSLQKRSLSQAKYSWLSDARYRDTAEAIGSSLKGAHTPKEAAVLFGSSLLSEAIKTTEPDGLALVTKARQDLSAHGIDSTSFEATKRYEWINTVVQRTVSYRNPGEKTRSDKIDAIVTHKIWGSAILLLIMAFIFQAIFTWASIPMEFIDKLFSSLSTTIAPYLPEGMFRKLIVDGVIPGVGSVVVFIPQISILFFFLGMLEDSGYLSRAAFLMDNIMRRVGLQGRSFIPLLSSFACAIPGIMSTRSIPSFADRMVTILVAPLMSCSARLPVYALLIAAFIPQTYVFGFLSLQGLILFSMYVLGVVGAALVALIIKRFCFQGEPALFVMEMPPFRIPSFKTIFRDILDRITLFLKSAGTIILACSIVLWFLASYPQGDVKQSFAGRIGAAIEPAIRPLGFNWEIGVGLLASFAAREVFVSSLATVYNVADANDSSSESLSTVLKRKRNDGSFSLPTALSLMVFYVFACQCMSTLAVCRRETNSWAWTAFMFGYMTLLAYGASFVVYNAAVYFSGAPL